MKSTNKKIGLIILGYIVFAIILASLVSCKPVKMNNCIQPTNYNVMKKKSKEIAKKDCSKVYKSHKPKFN